MNYKEKVIALLNSQELSKEQKEKLKDIFPELAESEDERIRKELIEYIKDQQSSFISAPDCRDKYEEEENNKYNSWIAWLERQGEKIEPIEDFDTEFEIQISHLVASAINREHEYNKGYVKWAAQSLIEYAKREIEKQGEHKPTDKVEPKFHEGDWVFIEEVKGYKNGPFQIKTVDSSGYSFDEYHTIPFMYEDLLSKWTIQDAKDGDVLYECNEKKPFIFKELKTKHIGDIASYCDIFNGIFNPNEDSWTTLDIVPATKEQCDILFQKMREAEYEWDAEKKELKKIEQKHSWSEEDISKIDRLIMYFKGKDNKEFTEWFSLLKDKVIPQPKQE